MNHGRWTIFSLAVLVLILAFIQQVSRNRAINADVPEPDLVREFPVFGTYAVLQLWGEDDKCVAVAAAIEKRMLDLHGMISLFDGDSELLKINRSAFEHEVECSPEMWELLGIARRAYVETDGAFDVSVGPLMKLWGFHGRQASYPDNDVVEATRQAVGLDKIIFDDSARTVRFTHPESYLDFGGLAKGYALDLAREIAAEHGLTAGIIDMGGNICCLTATPSGVASYSIGIRDPQMSDRLLDAVEMTDECIATSGNYESNIILDGRFVHHIIDPATGYPVPSMASVSVITRAGWVSDVYSTAIFVRGESLAQHFVEFYPGSRVVLVRNTDEGKREIVRCGIGAVAAP